jgi:glutamate synthase (NADPH/NADH) large chain
MVADLSGERAGEVVDLALTVVEHLEHRGASGSDPLSGDGAGILMALPDALLRGEFSSLGTSLPARGSYAAGCVMLPHSPGAKDLMLRHLERIAAEEGVQVLGLRPVPTDGAALGPSSRSNEPAFVQIALAEVGPSEDPLSLDRRAYAVRRRLEATCPEVYVCSLSSRTIVYKGMLTAPQLRTYFADFADPRMATSHAIVHSRFSTNTFPTWSLAHPFRFVAHNGEINTVTGNRNWMRARESSLASSLFEGDLERLLPICTPGLSDSASLDELIELLYLGGRSLPHAVLMAIPPAWEHNTEMPDTHRAFHRYHASLIEPWDGPASVTFSDGRLVGAVLDRNGLRPARWWTTTDGLVVFASEVGALPISPERVSAKGRLAPGRMFLVDTVEGRVLDDTHVRDELAAAAPYGQWLDDNLVRFADLPDRAMLTPRHDTLVTQQRLHGYTEEELSVVLAPTVQRGEEPVGSMGSDTPIAVLSTRPRRLSDYFTQLFAQVTNPPLDAIREGLVTSMADTIGPEGNLLDPEPGSCRLVVLETPVLVTSELAKLRYINEHGETPGFRAFALDGLVDVSDAPSPDLAGARLAGAIAACCDQVDRAIADGANLVILSDRNAGPALAPIPSLLLTAALHHHLTRTRQRMRASLVVECADARSVHDLALLLAYGASAVNPYLALDTVADLCRRGEIDSMDPDVATQRWCQAMTKGIRKVMSKMGVSTIASYRGAQLFEAIGVGAEVVDTYFTGTSSRLGGIELDDLASDMLERHAIAFPQRPSSTPDRTLEVGGEFQWRREGELHMFTPTTVFLLQHASRSNRRDVFDRYTEQVDDQSARLLTLRGLLRLRTDAAGPVRLDEVEPETSLFTRFATGAMSYGSISKEAHETVAIAMNRLGGRSNTGEGGEDAERWVRDANGDSRRSAIKQVASARFGVTSEYLCEADEIQIKISQGAKPGEGGQLPAAKVHPWIAATRHSTPGVELISPPPHHDIYSIEDLAQLIFDLRQANDRARISVKLVSEVGVGTVAAGVVKAGADVVLVSGHDGGTGAAPLTSIHHAGAPWELGLAETHQTLVANGLRDRVILQVDGQLRTGRDVVIATLLGAQEFGFATAPLVATGCVMMRVCHLDTCPVGIATQRPDLRARYAGRPEHLEAFFTFLATQVREHLATIGCRSIDDAVGRADLLEVVLPTGHPKAARLDLDALLAPHPLAPRSSRPPRTQSTARCLDDGVLDEVGAELAAGSDAVARREVRNTDRTVGTRIGSRLTSLRSAGVDTGSLTLRLEGSAGQSLGAFLPRGIAIELDGDANDYVGKGLCGGRLVLRPPRSSPFASESAVIAGNVLAYGATSGEIFARGVVGERCCVRNSGAIVVTEGVGDHGCEYMTGGRAVVLGDIGRNFAAGMSGGIAYLYDPLDIVARRCNLDSVELERLDAEDDEWLRATLERFVAATGSEVAARHLVSWREARTSFVAVVPHGWREASTPPSAADELVGASA